MPTSDPGVVRLIVLNYNGGPFVTQCLEHLHRLEWPADELELVLVDNASSDGSVEAVAERFPDVRIIANATNTGFPANNLGLRELDGVRYVGLVNNDGFVDSGWLRALVAALDRDPALGAAAAKLVLAPRFVDLLIETPAASPGRGDARELGVMITGVRVNGVDRWADAHVGEGAWGVEAGPDGPFQWTSGTARLRVPVDDGSGAPAPTDRPAVVDVELELRADEPKKVTLSSGSRSTVVEVGPVRRWVSATAEGRPYDVVQNAGSIVYDDGAGADRGFLERDEGQFDEAAEVFAWCGGSVLLRPAYVRTTGAFDERFFLYYEDTDWSWRGRAQGWRYRYVPGAVMRHLHAASSGEGSEVFAYHVERNRLLMLVKNAPARLAAREVLRYVLITASYARRDLVAPALSGHRPRPTIVVRRLRSFAGFLRLLPAMVVARRRLRARQVVPDAELTSWLVPREPA